VLSVDGLHTRLHNPEVPEQYPQSFLAEDFAFYRCKYLPNINQYRIIQREINIDLLLPEHPTLPVH
jgi:hypothetical protein